MMDFEQTFKDFFDQNKIANLKDQRDFDNEITKSLHVYPEITLNKKLKQSADNTEIFESNRLDFSSVWDKEDEFCSVDGIFSI